MGEDLHSDDTTIREGWQKEKVLGTGGFGTVTLWRNQKTGETMALKQCRWSNDPMMTPKHRQRWKLEVEIMKKLCHPNVIKTLSVPSVLEAADTELPVLGMEYCSGGDLRKILSKAENCCGLSEKHVIRFLRHISSAVEYLHSTKIIHRDLKPENIVLQEIDGKVIYKLIDLGYAKELDQGSLCTSFVGTLQYLAPELFMSQKYSCTVDFWSLGLVTHEVITGLRPFLPSYTPAQWIPYVKQKASADIGAFVSEEGKIVFTKEIPMINKISLILKKDLEAWLQVMLEWDPRRRGRRASFTAFQLLKTILSKKVVKIFFVGECRMLWYEVTERTSLAELQGWIATDTKIPAQEQELIFHRGHSLRLEEGALQCWANPEEEDVTLYLFGSHTNEKMPSTTIPPLVEGMMRNPKDCMPYEEQKKAWAQAVFLSYSETNLYQRVVQGYKANLMCLLSKNSTIHRLAAKMTSEMGKLEATSMFFQKSTQQDIDFFEAHVKVDFPKMVHLPEKWKTTFQASNKKILDLQEQVKQLESSSSSFNTRTIELQRTPYARSKHVDPLEETHQRVIALFDQLKRKPKERRDETSDNTEMVRLMCNSLENRVTAVQDVFFHLRKLKDAKQGIQQVEPKLKDQIANIESVTQEIASWQAQRQSDIWQLFLSMRKNIHHPTSADSSVLSSTATTPQTGFMLTPVFPYGLQPSASLHPSQPAAMATGHSQFSVCSPQLLIPAPLALRSGVPSPSISPALSGQGSNSASLSRFSLPSEGIVSNSGEAPSLSMILNKHNEESLQAKMLTLAMHNELNSKWKELYDRHKYLVSEKDDLDFTFLKDTH